MAWKELVGSKMRNKVRSKARQVVGSTVRLVGCAGVGVVGLLVDVPAVCVIAVAKSPVLLWKGWKQEVVGMEACVDDGSCSRSLCLPVTGAMLLLWPATVAASIASALLYSLKKGLYGALVAHREKSLRCGFKHVIAVVAEYDELSNDVIHLRRGTCLPKPVYHRHQQENEEQEPQPVSFRVIREVDLGPLLEFMSSSAGTQQARRLIEQGLLLPDEKLTLDSAAVTILSFLVVTAREIDNYGSSDCDPLETLQRQIRDASLDAREEEYTLETVLCLASPEDVVDGLDPIRKAMLQAFGRRIRGLAGFVARNSEFRGCYGELLRAASAAPPKDLISFD